MKIIETLRVNEINTKEVKYVIIKLSNKERETKKWKLSKHSK